MNRFKKLCLMMVFILLGISISGCDFGINDLENVNGEYQFDLGLDISDIISPKKSYEYLRDELEYMRDNSYQNIQLARKQSFKLLNIFGIADMAVASSELSSEQIDIQADLFENIRLINIYTNLESNYYVPSAVRSLAIEALEDCEQLLETFVD